MTSKFNLCCAGFYMTKYNVYNVMSVCVLQCNKHFTFVLLTTLLNTG